jgi:hypothetical protein
MFPFVLSYMRNLKLKLLTPVLYGCKIRYLTEGKEIKGLMERTFGPNSKDIT